MEMIKDTPRCFPFELGACRGLQAVPEMPTLKPTLALSTIHQIFKPKNAISLEDLTNLQGCSS